MSLDPAAYYKAACAVLGRTDITVTVRDGSVTITPEDGSPALPAIDQATLNAIDLQVANEAAAAELIGMINGIAAERDRRMALGFDHDFGDARGLHRIGTTPEDMLGWREVDDLADIYDRAGNGNALLDIVTDTGFTQVTATEWITVLKPAFTAFRQPLWAASFAIQAALPSITDYTNDAHWP